MARKVEIRLIDDLDGSTAEETVTFSVDGINYEIDLSSENAGALRHDLATYVTAGRRIGRVSTQSSKASRNTSGATSKTAAGERTGNQAIRDWAKAQGLSVNDRGRISAEIVEKYHAAGSAH
ncbi:histone-like nucleoid-structuring protein Lsr2 [Cryptosporangium minutisporangium]|uniref:Lsr2 family protein n=1 Tax=Cryptosporangium minutisporangium TaxID=113569 RepID=A0ABP6SVG0_9ACTN